MPAIIVGISAYEHGSASASAIVCDGEIVAAAQEMWFTKKENDSSFPTNALRYCLYEKGITITNLSEVVFYESPLLKFERLLETYLTCAPHGFRSFVREMPAELKHTLFLKQIVRRELAAIGGLGINDLPPIYFAKHQQSYAAAAFYPSPFNSAAVLTIGSGCEWSTTSLHCGRGNDLELEWEINYPHSIGLLCSAFSSFCGLEPYSSNYRLFRLATHGKPIYEDQIYKHLVDIKRDGSFRLNMDYFNCLGGRPDRTEFFSRLFGGAPRESYDKITQREVDLAASIQRVIEEVVLRLGWSAYRDLGEDHLCLTGEIAHNYAANSRLSSEGPFQRIWIQPAVGASGGAVGAALASWYERRRQQRSVRLTNLSDEMYGGYLGPCPGTNEEIRQSLESVGARYCQLEKENMIDLVATKLSTGSLVGWVQGRMAFGRHPLGARCILGDPRNIKTRKRINQMKNIDGLCGPSSLSVLQEDVSRYFNLTEDSPYMSFLSDIDLDLYMRLNDSNKSTPIRKQHENNFNLNTESQEVTRTSHIQTVDGTRNMVLHQLLTRFKSKTKYGILVNAAFNIPGQPIVCNVIDAYRCFLRMDLDFLVVETFLLNKDKQ